jgi:N-dimethylarginine dimethylaminohydrolase
MMCAPDHFAVNYVINPWMENNCGKTDAAESQQQWHNYKNHLSRFADIVLIDPAMGLPDMVYTANAALILNDIAVLSRFRNTERSGEEPLFDRFLADCGFNVIHCPANILFEGAGDALIDRGQDMIWAGYGFRSDRSSHEFLSDALECQVIGLHLIDPRYYHLDTCLCPLDGGYMMYHPAAFDADSIRAIESVIPREMRIMVDASDASHFACNAVDLNGHVFMNHASDGLQNRLRECGFTPVIAPLGQFLLGGGTAKCLTLKLIDHLPSKSMAQSRAA